MEETKLEVQVRSESGSRKAKQIRDGGSIPAIVYGEKKAPTSIKVDKREYEKIMRANKGQNVVFYISVLEGDKELRSYSAIVKEEQLDPVSDKLLHIDFNRISLTKEIEVKVAVVSKGEAIGVKQDGGILDHTLWELDVICLPTKIPLQIEVDVSELEIGDAIHLKDIVLPENVKTNHDLESILFSVLSPAKEEEDIPAEGEEESVEPEVIKDKKEKEEAADKEASPKE
ncbi:MAG: 50S ribosomal protein L25 [Candidatus Zapsychrus exili]|nr:50S ribosomal protein L25 [Candidatus Zapsychrus exili]